MRKIEPFVAQIRELSVEKQIRIDVPYARHYKPWLVYFYPMFEDHFFAHIQVVFLENYIHMHY